LERIKEAMSIDIRRMSSTELDELNRRGKALREHIDALQSGVIPEPSQDGSESSGEQMALF
jgi:hypothetical protein